MQEKSKFLSVRLTVEEREHLDRLARESGLSLSNVIRSCINRTEIRQRQPAEINDLYREINRIGVNINQIARSVNAGIATRQDAKEALFLLRQVYLLMEKVADLQWRLRRYSPERGGWTWESAMSSMGIKQTSRSLPPARAAPWNTPSAV